jgi:hypothetical protein
MKNTIGICGVTGPLQPHGLVIAMPLKPSLTRMRKQELEPIVENKHQGPDTNEGSMDKDERNPACEKVIIVDEHHQANQTMDEIYQNT